MSKGLDQWFKTLPEHIQPLAREFPLGQRIQDDERLVWVIGYTDGESLIVSPINPAEDMAQAMFYKEYMCAQCVRDRIVRTH